MANTLANKLANIENFYKETHSITGQDIQEFRQRDVDRKNMMAWGASMRGGQLTHKDEMIAEMLKKIEEEEKREEEEKNEKEKKWIEIVDPVRGSMHTIEIIRDRCSADNFVKASAVADYSLDTEQIKPVHFSDVAGVGFTCYQQATIRWKGKGTQIRVNRFYVVPDVSPIKHALVGKDFDDAHGSDLLDSNPQELVAYTAQKPKTPEEHKQILAMRKRVEDQVAESEQSKNMNEQHNAEKVVSSPSSKSWWLCFKKGGRRRL